MRAPKIASQRNIQATSGRARHRGQETRDLKLQKIDRLPSRKSAPFRTISQTCYRSLCSRGVWRPLRTPNTEIKPTTKNKLSNKTRKTSQFERYNRNLTQKGPQTNKHPNLGQVLTLKSLETFPAGSFRRAKTNSIRKLLKTHGYSTSSGLEF